MLYSISIDFSCIEKQVLLEWPRKGIRRVEGNHLSFIGCSAEQNGCFSGNSLRRRQTNQTFDINIKNDQKSYSSTEIISILSVSLTFASVILLNFTLWRY